VIRNPAFGVEPWALHETQLNLELLAQSESVFALANGHIGLRANLGEGEPNGLPGAYLNGFYEARPCPTSRPATATRRRGRSWSTAGQRERDRFGAGVWPRQDD
jgi:trehalose/maltose hydrolase-like predicted phosphorylase